MSLTAPTPTGALTQRRRSFRQKVKLPAEMSFGDRTRRLRVRVVDMSATGARVTGWCEREMPRTAGVLASDRIALYLDSHGTHVECQIVWHTNEECGVRFCSPFRHAARA